MISVYVNSIDISSFINWQSLLVVQNLTSQVDTASFQVININKDFEPVVNQEVIVYDDSEKIFGGVIVSISETVNGPEGQIYKIDCKDYSQEFDGQLATVSYESKTGKEIIDDLFSTYAPTYNTDNVVCSRLVDRIVFNNITLSECLQRLAKIMDYEWYVDADKNIFFFQRFSVDAPFELTDINGNYVYKSLQKTIDGTQIANQIRVRGGIGTETSTFSDIITVVGNDTKTFKLPYKFTNLTIEIDSGSGYVSKNVGIDNIDDFTTDDVLYNYQMDTIRFENPLLDGDLIRFTGNKKFPVMAIASDDVSIGIFGLREKLIKDNSIESTQIARERAIIELDTYKDNISDCEFKTYQSGLRVGMRIKISSEIRGIDELDYIINKVSFKTRTPELFEYNVSCSTARKYGLIEFLRNLSKGEESYKEDESEVAEIIKTDNQTIRIDEEIESISPKLDEQNIEIEEQIDDYDFEPDWVLSEYVPSSTADTKRAGKLDRSMTLY